VGDNNPKRSNGGKNKVVVIAANVTDQTLGLINDLLATDAFVRFALQNTLNLSDNTILIRLAIINLKKNMPNNEDVQRFKAALLRPHEFDNFLREELEETIIQNAVMEKKIL